MESDPFRLAWATNRLRHVVAGLLLLCAGLALLAGLELLRAFLDEVVAGEPARPLLRVTVSAFERIGLPPLELLSGFQPSAALRAPAVLAGLAAVPVVLALTLTGVGSLSAGIGTRVLARIRAAVVEAVLGAPGSVRDGATEAALLAGDRLAQESGILGSAVLALARSSALVALAGAYALILDWRLGGALAAMLALAGVLSTRRLQRCVELARVRRTQGAGAAQCLADLLQRSPAVRAHGTAAIERGRVDRALLRGHRGVERVERRLAAAEACAAAALLAAPLAVLAIGAWLAGSDRILTAGSLMSVTVAAALSTAAVRDIVHWRRLVEEVRQPLAELARNLAALGPRERRGVVEALPQAGALVARGLSAYDPATGGRISGIDLSLAFPAHVAFVGDGDLGPRVLANLIGGVLEPSTGRLTFGGVDLAATDPVERARRIAIAGGDTLLVPGTLRDNFLYGCPVDGSEAETRLVEA